MAIVDLEHVRTQVATRVPVRVRWVLNGTPLDFDFSRARSPLQTLESADMSGDIEKEWTRLYLFAEQRFAEGGGASPWIGVHQKNGEVFGLDVERESTAMFFMNSDVDRFIKTFLVFDEALRLGKISLKALSSAATQIDPLGYSKSDWRVLAEYVISNDEEA